VSTLTLPLVLTTTRDHHPVPLELGYSTTRPLEITLQALIPGQGRRTWVISRDALADTFTQWSVTSGATRIAVAGRMLTAVLELGHGRWMLLTGDSAEVFDFVDATFDLCPPCAGCVDPFCLSCVNTRRQVDEALSVLFPEPLGA